MGRRAIYRIVLIEGSSRSSCRIREVQDPSIIQSDRSARGSSAAKNAVDSLGQGDIGGSVPPVRTGGRPSPASILNPRGCRV